MKARRVFLSTAALPAVALMGSLALAQTQSPPPAAQSSASTTADPADTSRFDARVASIKSALSLSEEQQRLWLAAEAALREAFRQGRERLEGRRNQPAPTSLFERLQRRGELMSARGAAMTKLADAIKPLHDTLSDEQKRRVVSLMFESLRQYAGERARGDDRRGRGGEGRYGWDRDEDRDWRSRDWDRGRRGGDYDDDRRGRGYGYGPDRDYDGRGDSWRRGREDGAYSRYDRDSGRYGRWGDDDGRRFYQERTPRDRFDDDDD